MSATWRRLRWNKTDKKADMLDEPRKKTDKKADMLDELHKICYARFRLEF